MSENYKYPEVLEKNIIFVEKRTSQGTDAYTFMTEARLTITDIIDFDCRADEHQARVIHYTATDWASFFSQESLLMRRLYCLMPHVRTQSGIR